MSVKGLYSAVNPILALLQEVPPGASVVRVDLCVAYVSHGGLTAVAQALNAHGVDSSVVRVTAGFDVQLTQPLALYSIGREQGWRVRCVDDPEKGIFHPKVYAIHWADAAAVFLGSHNCSARAFESNDEAGWLTVLPAGHDELVKLVSYLDDLDARSFTLTEALAREASQAAANGLRTATRAAPTKRDHTAKEIVRFLMAHPEHAPCLSMLGPTDTAMDLALAFDYLRAFVGIDVPLHLCRQVVVRCNLGRSEPGAIPADLHRAFQSLKARDLAALIRTVEEWPDDWPDLEDQVAPLDESTESCFRWLFASARRSPLTHGGPPSTPQEWAYTLDFLHSVCGVPLPWDVCLDIVERSAGEDRILQPDSLRNVMKKSDGYDTFCRDKGWR